MMLVESLMGVAVLLLCLVTILTVVLETGSKMVSPFRKVVVCFDRGEYGTCYIHCSVSELVYPEDGCKDIGESSEEYVKGLIDEYV